MSDNDDFQQEAELRRKLVRRLAVAGFLVGLLLAALALFDFISSQDEDEAPVFDRPVPVPARKEVTQAVTPAVLTPPENASASETPATTAPVQEAAAPGVAEPSAAPAPEVSARPALPETRPAVETRKPVAPAKITEVSPARPAKTIKPGAPASVPEKTAAPMQVPTVAPVTPTPPVAPAPPADIRPPLPSVLPQTLPRLMSGYQVQAGVFTNLRAAEALHAKLALNGIPSTLEARVSVGPFKTRAEAEAAEAKLKALGIDPILLPPRRR